MRMRADANWKVLGCRSFTPDVANLATHAVKEIVSFTSDVANLAIHAVKEIV